MTQYRTQVYDLAEGPGPTLRTSDFGSRTLAYQRVFIPESIDRLQGVLVLPGIIYKCGCVPRHGFWRNDPECSLYFQRDLWPQMMKSHCSMPCSLTTEQGRRNKQNTASAAKLLYEKSFSLPSLLNSPLQDTALALTQILTLI